VSYVTTVLADGPRHYWRCSDPGGGFLHDIGAAAQKALTVTGQNTMPYSGVASEGGSTWIDAGGGAIHRTGDTAKSPQSLECWVWLHFPPVAQEIFLSHVESLGISAAGLPTWFNNAANLASAVALTEQTWHHLVGTYGPANGQKLYVDALQVGTGAFGAGFGPVVAVESLGISVAGANTASANIAEAATYDIELTPARITAHYLAADTLASRPTYKPQGTFDVTTGISDLSSADIAAILAAVRRTY
jgi:hypothetical protein